MISAAIILVELVCIKPWPIFVDSAYYYAMAKNPFVFMTPDGYTGSAWGYRILTPWLVHILPLPIDDGFRLVTTASLLLTSLALYVFLTKSLGFSPKIAILGQVLLLVDVVMAYNIANFRLTDPLSYFLLILGLYFAWNRKSALFAGSAVVAILNREMQFLLAPVYYFINKRKGLDLRCLTKTILLMCPALLAFLALHFLMSGQFQEPSASSLSPTGLTGIIVSYWLANPIKSVGLFVLSWSLLWFTGILGFLKYCDSTRAKGLASIVPFAALLAIPYDTSRMLAYAFPAIIPYTLYAFSSWSRSRRGLLVSVSVVVVQILLQIVFIMVFLSQH